MVLQMSFHPYLDDQVDVWRRVRDGEDAGSGQRGRSRMRRVRLQEVSKLLRVQIKVEVLRYLEGNQRWTELKFSEKWFSTERDI